VLDLLREELRSTHDLRDFRGALKQEVAGSLASIYRPVGANLNIEEYG
jgi:hypothetical protein